jgi:hypothetical protein
MLIRGFPAAFRHSKKWNPTLELPGSASRKQQAWQKAYAEMRAKYIVMLPAPPSEAVKSPGKSDPVKKQVPTSSGEAPL